MTDEDNISLNLAQEILDVLAGHRAHHALQALECALATTVTGVCQLAGKDFEEGMRLCNDINSSVTDLVSEHWGKAETINIRKN